MVKVLTLKLFVLELLVSDDPSMARLDAPKCYIQCPLSLPFAPTISKFVMRSREASHLRP
jgi:hypothetical protein